MLVNKLSLSVQLKSGTTYSYHCIEKKVANAVWEQSGPSREGLCWLPNRNCRYRISKTTSLSYIPPLLRWRRTASTMKLKYSLETRKHRSVQPWTGSSIGECSLQKGSTGLTRASRSFFVGFRNLLCGTIGRLNYLIEPPDLQDEKVLGTACRQLSQIKRQTVCGWLEPAWRTREAVVREERKLT